VTVIGPGGTSATSVADQFTYTGVSLPAWLGLSGGGQVVWNAAAQTLEIQSGTATILADPNEVRFNGGAGDEPVITVDSGAKLEVAPTDGSMMVHIGGLKLNSGASADVAQLEAPTATQLANGQYVASDDATKHEALVIGKLNAANDPVFSLDPNSTLDMENNDLIIHTGSSDANGYTLLASVQAMAYGPGGGRNGGLWSGKRLTSTVAKNQDASDGGESVQLGVVDNADMGVAFSSWKIGNASEAIGSNDLLIKYTYTGDFNLDGKVDGADYNIFALNYDAGASTGNDWALGDTNDDGLLNGQDYNNFSFDFNNGTANGNDTVQL
jgi:hypothetical protein